MAKMKENDIIWFGKIPKDWEISKISEMYELRTTKVSDKDYAPLSVTMNGIVPQLDSAAKTNAHDDRKLVKKGDFAINSRSDRRGSCGISNYDGSVSLINIVMKPRDEMNPDYYNWLFHTTQFADEFYKWGHGIVNDLWTTNWQDMRHIDIPVPSLLEQEKIATFLDSKCTEIAALYTDIEKQIEILEEYKKSVITETVTKGLNPDAEMKDSGIEWIGKIPKDWENKRIKYVSTIIRGGSPRPIENFMSDTDEGYNWVKIGDTTKGSKYITGTATKIIPSGLTKTRLVHPGTLLLTNSMSFGEPYIMAIDGCIHDGWVAFFDYKSITKEFLYYSLLSNASRIQFEKSSDGGVVQNLNIDKVGRCHIALPSEKEQQEIVDYLDAKCTEINGAIAEKKEQLDVLEQYKKSLIYEYVTGKKEIK